MPMKSRVFRYFAFSISICLISLAPSMAVGQWHPDSSVNTAVCDTIGQQDYPKGCTDGANGAIFVWEDGRYGVFQIFAQHIDQYGKPRWNRNGVRVASSVNGNPAMTNPIITSDDSGGAYVVWLDSRNVNNAISNGTCLFAQHILADGSMAYPDTGLAVAIGLNSCLNPAICDDGFGGAFVAWEDYRACDPSTRPDIWMNRLWPRAVKYGLTTTGTQGTLTKNNVGTMHSPKYEYDFHDPNGQFNCYMVGLSLTIAGKGSYTIASVLSDTQISLKTYPTPGTFGAYSVGNLTGLPIDTIANKQVGPVLVNDGKGGCFLAWTSNATIPNSIYGTHIDSTCKALWDPAPQAGFQFYRDLSSTNLSKNVTLNRDGNQLLLAWETLSPNDGEEIFAQRMSCSTPMDTTFLWGDQNDAVDVTSNQLQDQINPLIFSDDSAVSGQNGALVPFMDDEPGTQSNYDIAMVRVLGSGGELLPRQGTGFWYYEQKPNMHNNLLATKITDTTNKGANTGLLAVWNDDWDGPDTMLYAQRIDRNGRKYFPTAGTHNSWGICISGNAASGKTWSAREPCLVPRTDGAIVAWTDFRSGTAAIYCQLIRMDGSLWIPADTNPPALSVLSSTPPDDTSQCNSQCTTVLATAPGTIVGTEKLKSGIQSVDTSGMINMVLQTPHFSATSDSVTFTVCVNDSLENGSGTITVIDSLYNTSSMSFNYCTIPDSRPPVISVDTLSTSPFKLAIQISDDGPWDRGLKSVSASDSINLHFTSPPGKITLGEGSFLDTVSVITDTLRASFSLKAVDVAGNTSIVYNFSYTPLSGVAEQSSNPVSISVYPNPTSGDATIQLDGAPSADVTVLDVLGHTIDQFNLTGSHDWQSGALAPGIYIVRAAIGDLVVCKKIVKE